MKCSCASTAVRSSSGQGGHRRRLTESQCAGASVSGLSCVHSADLMHIHRRLWLVVNRSRTAIDSCRTLTPLLIVLVSVDRYSIERRLFRHPIWGLIHDQDLFGAN